MSNRTYKGQPARRVPMPKGWRRVSKPASLRRRAARRVMALSAAVAALLLIVGAWSPNANAWPRHGGSNDAGSGSYSRAPHDGGYGGTHHAPRAQHYDGGRRYDRGQR